MAAPRGNKNNSRPPNRKPRKPATPGQSISRAAANKFVSPNIGGEQPTGDVFGAYDSGTTLDKIRRNEYLNTLDVETRARVMNKMGYWTGGVRTNPGLVTPDKAWLKAIGSSLQPGQKYQPQKDGTFLGTVTKTANGKIQWEPAGRGKARGGKKGANSGGRTAGGTAADQPPIISEEAAAQAAQLGGAFATGVSGKTGEFIKEAGKSRYASGEAETNTTKKKNKGRKKLVRRVVKKTNVKGKAVRRALRSPGVTKSDKRVYAKVARQATPKLSDRLRRADRRKK